jgi:formylglycine-generating enzyme required for sulfatase activity
MSEPAAVPAQLGRYRILSKLGQGGMGAVYLAEDTLLSRRVAVKVPHFTPDDGPGVVERFHREARAAAAIDHPHLCPVHDFGEVGGVHFLVMPYIEGMPLSRLIGADNPWPPARAAALVRQLALAVEALHQRGLIHRDLKPSNVLIRPDGSPVLMDFGLARSFSEQGRRLTQTGAALGTPAYMAPEQILGESKTIGPATDVYEMGVILYELLTGGLPFVGPFAAVYGQILHAQPEPPSARRPGLDAALDAVCLKALAKKPAERFASMAAFAEALVPWACPVAAVASPPPVTPQPVPGGPHLTCPGCGKSLKVPPTAAGKRLQCPNCRTVLVAAAVTQYRSPPNRAGVDTAAPSLLETVAAPPHPQPGRVRERANRKALVMGLVGAALLVVSLTTWLVLHGGGKQAETNSTGKDFTPPPPELRNTIGMQFVRIEPGTFLMGSPDGTNPPGVPAEEGRNEAETPHRVKLTKRYYLGAHLVTQEQWEQVMGKDANHSGFKGKDDDEKKKLPVDSVTWFDCVEFCIKLSEKEKRKPHYRLTSVLRNEDGSIKAAEVELLAGGTGYRLPTEAEWEYACRAGTGTPFWWGNTITPAQANYDCRSAYGKDGKKYEDSYRPRTTPVGKFKPNDWGLYDMHGNLLQWCQDWYGKDYHKESDKKDPQGPNSGTLRVLRGGSWFNFPRYCRAAYRSGFAPANRQDSFGCRLLLRLD